MIHHHIIYKDLELRIKLHYDIDGCNQLSQNNLVNEINRSAKKHHQKLIYKI